MTPNLLLRRHSRFCGFLLIVALAALPGYAQPVYVSGSGTTNFGLQTVGTSVTTTLRYSFPQPFSLITPSVVTQGVTGADFQMTGGTCATGSWLALQACTVQLTFTPLYPGVRMGAVVFPGLGGTVAAITYLEGVGTGPMPASSSPPLTQFSLPVFPDSVAVDSGGNVYLGALGSVNGQWGGYGLFPMIANSNSTGASITGRLNGASAMAIDGAGIIYVSDPSSNCVWETTPSLPYISRTTTCLSPPAGATVAGPLAVDGFANLYLVDSTTGAVLEFVPSSGNWETAAACGYGSCQICDSGGCWSGSGQVTAIGVDGAMNLYIATPEQGGSCYDPPYTGGPPPYPPPKCNGAVWKVPNSVAATPAQWTKIWQGTGSAYYSTTHAQSLALDGAATVYIIDSVNNLWKVPQGPWPYSSASPQALVDTNSLGLGGWSPSYIAMDQLGNAWVANQNIATELYELGGANSIPTIVTVTTNGVCGSANNATVVAEPAQNLCAAGTASAVAGSGPWTWTCNGTNGGQTASCAANIPTTPVNGVCGSAISGSFNTPPTANLCTAGNAAPVPVAGSGPWSWTCSGFGGGLPASCISQIPASGPVNGLCGPAAGQSLAGPPGSDLCSVGHATGVNPGSSSGTWSWSCLGVRGGAPASCSTAAPSSAAAPGTVTTPLTGPTGPCIQSPSPYPYGSSTCPISGPIDLGADSSGNVYYSYHFFYAYDWPPGSAIAPLSSPGGRLLNCQLSLTTGQPAPCAGFGAWTAYGNGRLCYVSTYTWSGSTVTGYTLHCGGGDVTVHNPNATIFAVDSTGQHVYVVSYVGGAPVILDGQTVVVGGGAGTYLGTPTALAMAADKLYIFDRGNRTIYKFDPVTKSTTGVMYLYGGQSTNSMAVDPSGIIFFASGGTVYRAVAGTGVVNAMSIPNLKQPSDVALDGQGSLYVVDAYGSWQVIKVANATQGNGALLTPVNAYCGSAAWGTFTSTPSQNLCDSGTPSPVFGSGSGPYTWTCFGLNYGASQSCSTYPTVLTVTANNASMTQGGSPPALSASYTGWVNGDQNWPGDVLSGAPALSTTATASSPPGNYPITVKQGTLSSGGLYTFNFVPGTLSVLAAPSAQLSTTATLAKQAGAYQATVTVANTGNADATNVVLTAAALGTAAGTSLPQTLGTVKAGGSATVTVTFPSTAGADGAIVIAKYAGTYTGGSFAASSRVTLP